MTPAKINKIGDGGGWVEGTTFEIGADAEKYIQKHAARLKDLRALVSRATRRKTSEGTGTLIIPSELDFMAVAAEQDGFEQPKK